MSTESETLGQTQTFEHPKRNAENQFKILVATDIHLGYNEKDPIRGKLWFCNANVLKQGTGAVSIYKVLFVTSRQ